MHPSAPQKTFSLVLRAEGIVFGTYVLGMLCDVIPCSVVLFPDQSDDTSLCHPSRCREEGRVFDRITF